MSAKIQHKKSIFDTSNAPNPVTEAPHLVVRDEVLVRPLTEVERNQVQFREYTVAHKIAELTKESSKNELRLMKQNAGLDLHKRTTPTITEFYQQAAGPRPPGRQRPLVFLPGLKNYSSILFGDDRISYLKSVTTTDINTTDRIDVNKMEILREQEIRALQDCGVTRAKDYAEAWEAVGYKRLTEVEELTRRRIQVVTRNQANDIGRVFDIFDRNHGKRLEVLEFARGLKLLNLQFKEVEIFGLFGVLDIDLSGSITYAEFCRKFATAEMIAKGQGEDADADMAFGESNNKDKRDMQNVLKMRIQQHFDEFAIKGSLNAQGASRLLEKLKLTLPTADRERMLKVITADGSINFERFFEMWNVCPRKVSAVQRK